MERLLLPMGPHPTIHEETVDSRASAIITKTFEYKIRATREFVEAAERALDASRFVYNCALEQRIMRYRQGKPIGYIEQSKELTEARTQPDVGDVLRNIQQDALERLDAAFLAFFKRVKKGEMPGFPRFKGRSRYRTFSQKIEKQRGCPLEGDRLAIAGVGSVRVRLSRPIEGRVKQLRITKRVDGWYALLVCDLVKTEPLPPTGASTGIDVGLEHFATLSTGETIANPRHLRRMEKALGRSQQALSRKQRTGANRRKARQRVALRHLKTQRGRKDFHHKTALDLVRRFDRIAVEDLQIRNMVRNPKLAKSIADAGWGQFLAITKCKAENAGRTFEKVNPRHTSQICSACGQRQPMPIALRVFECGGCGLSIDRDHNAALNIGRGAPESKPAFAADPVRASRNRYARRKSGAVTTTAPILPRA